LRAWIYILIAVVLQTLWGIVLKVLDFGKAFELIGQGQIWDLAFAKQILPILAYFILGLVIAIVISKAYKLLPMSIVYAAWMGLTLLLQVIVDVFLYHIPMQIIQYIFIAFILAGILGMKLSKPKSIQPVEIEIDDSVD
jgi:quaternary ammonium compound-resistance protein SugE